MRKVTVATNKDGTEKVRKVTVATNKVTLVTNNKVKLETNREEFEMMGEKSDDADQ